MKSALVNIGLRLGVEVFVEAIELLAKAGLVDAGAGAEARDVLVNCPKVAAKEVVAKVISRMKGGNLSILLIT